jgi:hypothetical protein
LVFCFAVGQPSHRVLYIDLAYRATLAAGDVFLGPHTQKYDGIFDGIYPYMTLGIKYFQIVICLVRRNPPPDLKPRPHTTFLTLKKTCRTNEWGQGGYRKTKQKSTYSQLAVSA